MLEWCTIFFYFFVDCLHIDLLLYFSCQLCVWKLVKLRIEENKKNYHEKNNMQAQEFGVFLAYF